MGDRLAYRTTAWKKACRLIVPHPLGAGGRALGAPIYNVRVSHNRLTRQEIKHDEFVSGVARVVRWTEDHRRAVTAGVAVVAGCLVLGIAGQAWWQMRQEKALAAFAEVERRYHAPVQGEQDAVFQRPTPGLSYSSREEKYRAVLEAADSTLERFSSGPAARHTLYYKGLALRELARYDEAVSILQDLLRHRLSPLPRALAQVALAQTYEAAERWAEGAAAYRSLFEMTGQALPREAALLGQARCLEREQKVEEARALYRQILDAYPGSPYVSEAEERLKQSG